MKKDCNLFWSGLTIRLIIAPFILQWFHPDERQILEFAHFHAHGRLAPFLESRFHLRNQTIPWLLSWPMRGLDYLGLEHPYFSLLFFHLLIGTFSWLGFWKLFCWFKENHPENTKVHELLGWGFAFFWGFVLLYSRQLLESLAFAPTCFLFWNIYRGKLFRAGLWGGASAMIRYPNLLWIMGGFIYLAFSSRTPQQGKINHGSLARKTLQYAFGFCLMVVAFGVVDYQVYGSFLKSFFAYLDFNRPHGPVEQMFGNDSLWVYWRWFEYLFTPWLTPVFVIIILLSFIKLYPLTLFCIPYLIGHFWTPHREPRFLLPLTPFLVLAAFHWGTDLLKQNLATQKKVTNFFKWKPMKIFIQFHVFLNFFWLLIYAWGQTTSAQAVLLRNFDMLSKKPTELISMSLPLIDALVPQSVRWASEKCQWHRPELSLNFQSTIDPQNISYWLPTEFATRKVYVISHENMDSRRAQFGCQRLSPQGTYPPPLQNQIERLLRVQQAGLWSCELTILSYLCPQGLRPSENNEPYFGNKL